MLYLASDQSESEKEPKLKSNFMGALFSYPKVGGPFGDSN